MLKPSEGKQQSSVGAVVMVVAGGCGEVAASVNCQLRLLWNRS